MLNKKFIRNTLLIMLALAGVGLIGLELLARTYREKAGTYFRTQFTRNSDLVLRPFVTSVSIWRNFPGVTFTFNNIILVDTSSAPALQVVAVKRAEVIIPLSQFNLSKIRIRRVNLNNLVFHQRIDSAGNKSGFRLQQEIKADTSAGNLSFIIKKLSINNGQFMSENYFKKNAVSINVNQTELKVERVDKQLKVSGQLQGKINFISNKQLRLYKNQPFVMNANYLFKAANNTGYISNTQVLLHGNKLNVTGTHTRLAAGNGARLNITMAGYQPLIYIFRQLIPPSALPVLDKIKSNSNVYLTCRLQGDSGPRLRPRSIIKFKLTNGEIYVKGSKSIIKGVQLAGSLDNGPAHGLQTSRLTVSKASAQIGKGYLKLNFNLTNFLQPTFAFQANGRLDLPSLARLFPLPITQVNQGILSGNLKLNGNFTDTLNRKQPVFSGQGIIRLENASFRPEGLTVLCRQVNGEFRLSENNLVLKNLSGKMANQPFKLSASIQNYVPYLFGQPGNNIKAKVTLQASQFKSAWLEGTVFAAVPPPDKARADRILPASNVITNPANGKLAYVRASSFSKPENNPKSSRLGSSSNQQSNRILQSLLVAASSQVNVQVGLLALTGAETIRNLAFQVNQRGQQVSLTQMQFNTAEGGKATATGGFQLSKAGIRTPRLKVKLRYDFLNLQTFMQHIASLKESAPKTNRPLSSRQRKQIKKFKKNDYWVQLQVNARRVQYEYLKGTDLVLNANVNNYRAELIKLDMHAFGGQISSKGIIYLDEPTGLFPVRLQAKVADINLPQLFAVANQMNLDVLSSQNIKGTVSCNLAVLTYLDKSFAPGLNKTVAYAKANFNDMELIEVTPIQNALRFLRNERTDHLYFEDVTTRFILENNQFLTPKLQLNSNLTDFELSGKYVMGGGANLNMDINVLNVIFGNNKRRIERIQADSTAAKNDQNKQHLLLIREQNKYKVKLNNKKDRAESAQALKEEFNAILRHHQLDTIFTVNKN